MQLEVAAATHVGRRRKTNADAHVANHAAGLYAVADGIGDTPRSGIVAKMALEAVSELFLPPWSFLPLADRTPGEASERLLLGVAQASGRLYAPGRTKEQQVGTTFAAVVICGSRLCVGHAGDSRVGLLRRRQQRLAQLTEDDTVFCDSLWRGVPYDVAADLPNRHALTRALGLWPSVMVRPTIEQWEPGDVVAIYTDGVSDRVEAPAIAHVLMEFEDLGAAAQRLIDRANEAGGSDNSTLVLVRWVNSSPESGVANEHK
jgi:serine/threonine protein phosphatase PrpC